MKRSKNGSTLKQAAYAMHRLAPKGAKSRQQIALDVGYKPSVAKSITQKIESTEGYANAMRDLAAESGNVVLQILHTLKHKDMAKEDFKTLIQAADTMASVWDRMNIKPKEKGDGEKINNLKVIFQNHAKGATVDATAEADTIKADTIQDQE
jgi:hypothetical protein